MGANKTYVTNGYMTAEALAQAIESGLEAMDVDIKGDASSVKKFCKMLGADQVWAAAKLARSRGVHIEITKLVIPTVNDSNSVLGEIAERVAEDLGCEVPWHVTRYYPAYQFAATDSDSGARLANRQRARPGIRLHGQRAPPSI